ncbi:kinesin-domain-containing protein [Neoconidiobolus thromboides FSU 785]|nr:kinesin-domain-containing protein [Neoconidiobolus thromboides FSU 785]
MWNIKPNSRLNSSPSLKGSNIQGLQGQSSIAPNSKKRKAEFESQEKGIECPIQVYIRCRGGHQHTGNKIGTELIGNSELQCKEGNSRHSEIKFKFDQIFNPHICQEAIFNEVALPMIDEALCGLNSTLFAYGQTGTGKTYTMEGALGQIGILPETNAGIIPRVLHQLYKRLDSMELPSKYVIKISMLEIYNEEIYDLLSIKDATKPNSKIILNKVSNQDLIIKGLTEKIANTPDEAIEFLRQGSNIRHTASTKLNKSSSRSHSIYTINIKVNKKTEASDHFINGKLYLVDLAGSEDISRSGTEKVQAAEAGKINRSLLTLGKIIKGLSEKSTSGLVKLPFRESKLTRILEDSLGGGTKTRMIATISLLENDLKETINTLKYATQAKYIKNKPKHNVTIDETALYIEYKNENMMLKDDLKDNREKNGVYLSKAKHDKIVETMKALSSDKSRLETFNQDFEAKLREERELRFRIEDEYKKLLSDKEDKLNKALIEVVSLKKQNQIQMANKVQSDKAINALLNQIKNKCKELERVHGITQNINEAGGSGNILSDEISDQLFANSDGTNQGVNDLLADRFELKNSLKDLLSLLKINSSDSKYAITRLIENLDTTPSIENNQAEGILESSSTYIKELGQATIDLFELLDEQTPITCTSLTKIISDQDKNTMDLFNSILTKYNKLQTWTKDLVSHSNSIIKKKIEETTHPLLEIKKLYDAKIQVYKEQYAKVVEYLENSVVSHTSQKAQLVYEIANLLERYTHYEHNEISDLVHESKVILLEKEEESTKFRKEPVNESKDFDTNRQDCNGQISPLENGIIISHKSNLIKLKQTNEPDLLKNIQSQINESEKKIEEAIRERSAKKETPTYNSDVYEGNNLIKEHSQKINQTLESLEFNHNILMSQLSDIVIENKDNLVNLISLYIHKSILPQVETLNEFNKSHASLTTAFVDKHSEIETTNPKQYVMNSEGLPSEFNPMISQNYGANDINEATSIKEGRSEPTIIVDSIKEKVTGDNATGCKSSSLKTTPLKNRLNSIHPGLDTVGPIRSSTLKRQNINNKQTQHFLGRPKIDFFNARKDEPKK